MNIEEVIRMECPRYLLEKTVYHGTEMQVIRDTHGRNNVVLTASLNDETFEKRLQELNADYEKKLRQILG